MARYAEDNPTSEATCKPPPIPYRYRDWVIGAFNADMPYDRFVRLPARRPTCCRHRRRRDCAALGFLGPVAGLPQGAEALEGRDRRVVADEWDERVDTRHPRRSWG